MVAVGEAGFVSVESSSPEKGRRHRFLRGGDVVASLSLQQGEEISAESRLKGRMCLLPFREKTTLPKQSQPLLYLESYGNRLLVLSAHVRSVARTSKFSNSTTVRKIRNFNLLCGRFALLSLPLSSSLCAPDGTSELRTPL